MNGQHRDPELPTQVMHEDDPVLTRVPRRFFTRRSLRRLGGLFATITFVLIVLTGYELLASINDNSNNVDRLKNQQNQINQERSDRSKDVNQAVCALIDAVPPGDARIDAARVKFQCGAYIPEKNSPFTPKPTTDNAKPTATPTSTRSTSSASTPSTKPVSLPTTLPTTTVTKSTPVIVIPPISIPVCLPVLC